ncbi:class I poly(R)-hydroxyalkanoic acid synthase [Altererythrobacter sp. H2]|uniref:PHA/PHB synthase family protein n=1 Tax=Altererythrobacter sp. H2 TaxID=3108391 RepID=UPI002B4BE9EF|nr:class I poly(R)-hydroxyalkanoic acid synthase [Altererythrobacter sp. H2]WRK96140.1 class I poly(R)-hydroxyalkanoic acid synthase [Altererythrobacter sp. H2]
MAGRQDPFGALFDMQGEAMREMFAGVGLTGPDAGAAASGQDGQGDQSAWLGVAGQLQSMWLSFLAEKGMDGTGVPNPLDPAQFLLMTQGWAKAAPFQPEAMQQLVQDGMDLWQGVLGSMLGKSEPAASLPRKDRRFADPAWTGHPAYTLLHQTYLMVADYLVKAARDVDGVPDEGKAQLRFATQALVDAMSPDNFLATNPVVLKRTIETGGQNLVKGLGHLINDLRRGQLTHTDAEAFTLGENLAATPGKVVHETRLFQLIQYTPTTDKVLATPLVIFPPWINRFYILDLTPKKSFIKWAVDQGVSVFVVSWKSADASLADVEWDDYIRAQIETIDFVRARLDVPAVHAIGYCVAGTTLAATLAILARRGEAEKVRSATFFTAQVDFERAGELLNFIDDKQMELIGSLSPDGYLDGRFLAATFNSLRGKDLIWNYVVNNYLLGEDYPAFDLLHWNGDVTNLPARWHLAYLRDLYRDNKLVKPDAMSADGTPIDLGLVETPSYVQAGKEDHIAPAESVWRITEHFSGDVTFLLAGSGHIAGVVNPPAAGKYQYWTGDSKAGSLKEFVAGATEHPGSWWPNWLAWLCNLDGTTVAAKGKRVPGGKGDSVIEDAPGRYVKTR